jgi:hypothetical protein
MYRSSSVSTPFAVLTNIEAAKPKRATMNSAQQDDADPLVGFNPLDLFCSSHDTLRGHDIDQFIPANLGWTSGVGGAAAAAAASGAGQQQQQQAGLPSPSMASQPRGREEMQLLCRRGIPPSLRCAIWIINVVSAANPNMSKRDCDEFGTLRKMRVIGKSRSDMNKNMYCTIPIWINTSYSSFLNNLHKLLLDDDQNTDGI